MKKKKIIITGIFILFVILFVFIKDRIENKLFYDFKSLIKNEFSYVHDIDLSDTGPHCMIHIYVKKGNYEFDKVEPVFIYTMKKIISQPYFSYFLNHHNKKASGEFTFLNIAFRKQGDDKKEFFRFSTSKSENFEKWEIFKNEDKYYYVQDYINK